MSSNIQGFRSVFAKSSAVRVAALLVEHARTAGSNRRREFPRRHQERIIPRNDSANRAIASLYEYRQPNAVVSRNAELIQQ